MAVKSQKVTMQIRTKLKGEELEVELANHMATLRERDRIVEAKDDANRGFKKELKEKDGLIADQRMILDKGQLGDVEIEIITHPKGKKTYMRTDTKEMLDDDDIPEQLEMSPSDGTAALGEASLGGNQEDD